MERGIIKRMRKKRKDLGGFWGHNHGLCRKCGEEHKVAGRPSIEKEGVCIVCSKHFLYRSSSRPRKYCSLSCHHKFRDGKTYEELYGVEKAEQIKAKVSENSHPPIPWNRGLTKEIDERLLNLSKRYQNKDSWNKGKKLGSVIFSAHTQEILKQIKIFEEQGFKCILTDFKPIPDFIAIKGENIKVYAVEVDSGRPRPEKYQNTQIYDDVFWITFHKQKKGKKNL